MAEGTVAIGEIGQYVPDVRTIPISGKGFVIEFTSGMMDFDYAVGRALAGVHIGHTEKGADNAKALELPSVASLVAQVFREWAQHTRWSWFWSWRRIKRADFPLDDNVRNWVESIVTTAELFTLAHELGHVACNCALCPPISGNKEEDADIYGLRFFLPMASKEVGRRRAYAGAVYAIRLLAGLERLGVRFSSKYPPQVRRVELLWQEIRSQCPSEQFFHEVMTIASSYQDLMDDIENHLVRDSSAVLPNAERTLIRLLAQLEEVARGRDVTKETFVADIIALHKMMPTETLRQAAITLFEYYVSKPPPESCIRADLRMRMAKELVLIIEMLPQDLKQMFPEVGSGPDLEA